MPVFPVRNKTRGKRRKAVPSLMNYSITIAIPLESFDYFSVDDIFEIAECSSPKIIRC